MEQFFVSTGAPLSIDFTGFLIYMEQYRHFYINI